MMSDHWKKLANLLGTPGPADPPETVRTPVPGKETPPQPAAAPPPAAQSPAPPPPAGQRPQPPAASSAAPRQRTSMWGDDSENETRGNVSSAEPPSPRRDERTPAVKPKPRREETSDDALSALGAIQRDPPVPGFELPPGDSPERPAAPPKRSAWDTLIGTLGIKPAAEPEVEARRPPAAPAPAQSAGTRPPAEELGGPSGFGAGLLEPAEPPRSEPPRSEPPRSEPPAGRAAEERASDEQERPRGFGRRSGTRTEESLSGSRTASAGEFRRATADDEAEGPSRRRSRRRGQRQVLAEAGFDPQHLEESPAEGRADDGGGAAARSDLGPARRDERRDRGRGRERGRDLQAGEARPERESRPEREARAERPGPAEDRRRGEPRLGRRRDEVSSDLDLPGEDPLEGFAAGLLPEEPPAESGEEPRVRSRRRRGRRGRGGAAAREEAGAREENLHDENASVQDDPWATVDAPGGLESDFDEPEEGAEPVRRRARGTRARNRRDAASTERSDSGSPPVAATSERKGPAKQYNAPTWIETVSLLVEANIQRRASSGNGNGRGGRR